MTTSQSLPLCAALAAMLLAATPPAPAAAQPAPPTSEAQASPGSMCGERVAVVTRLRDQYGETRRGYGLQRESSVVEVYVSDTTGSWTILMTMPNGIACLVAAGQHWAPAADTAQAAGPRL